MSEYDDATKYNEGAPGTKERPLTNKESLIESPNAHASGIDLTGGVVTPDGYTLVHEIMSNHDDGENSKTFSDLLPTTEIQQLNGVSVTIDKGFASSEYGTMRGRLIADFGARAYVFRKDTPDGGDDGKGLTHFIVSLSHQEHAAS